MFFFYLTPVEQILNFISDIPSTPVKNRDARMWLESVSCDNDPRRWRTNIKQINRTKDWLQNRNFLSHMTILLCSKLNCCWKNALQEKRIINLHRYQVLEHVWSHQTTFEFHEIYLFFYEIFKGKKVRIIISVLLLVYSIPYNS